jgi:hypothetical protein
LRGKDKPIFLNKQSFYVIIFNKKVLLLSPILIVNRLLNKI